MYLDTRSIRETARRIGLSKTGVEYALKQLNVPRFPRNRSGQENSSRKSIKDGSPSAMVRDPSLMFGLYHVEGLSIPEIARVIGSSRTAVITGLGQCGIETRSISEGLKGKPRPNSCGPLNHAWRGGSTPWRHLARTRLNTVFVRPVMERDHFRCQKCGDKRKIEVHHSRRTFAAIVAEVRSSVSSENKDVFVNAIVAAHSLDDGLTLCTFCHDQVHQEGL